MRKLIGVDLLVIDDFALQPLDMLETADVYELCVERHHSKATVLTSNRDPSEWLAAMADPLLAQSAIDRLRARRGNSSSKASPTASTRSQPSRRSPPSRLRRPVSVHALDLDKPLRDHRHSRSKRTSSEKGDLTRAAKGSRGQVVDWHRAAGGDYCGPLCRGAIRGRPVRMRLPVDPGTSAGSGSAGDAHPDARSRTPSGNQASHRYSFLTSGLARHDDGSPFESPCLHGRVGIHRGVQGEGGDSGTYQSSSAQVEDLEQLGAVSPVSGLD